MFEDATFHSSGILHDKTPRWMLLTFAINLCVISALIALPLISPESLPSRLLKATLFAPPVLPVTVTPIRLATAQQATATMQSQAPSIRNPFEPPRQIPNTITTQDTAPPPGTGTQIPADATPGGMEAQTNLLRPTTQPTVRAAPTQKTRISEGVAQGQLLSKTAPNYPAIAKTVGVSGTVVLTATISKTGTIENLQVVSGSPLLRQAAIDAVQNWRYRPFLLSGQPVEVETTINVVFSLSSH
ncbi:energy transducer TonB [Acidicapsa ligni]|uniref:energy transducer TonB n=1 Tax=Acidicapsa ligni TaxID=542300 RepID=UPI0021DF90BB|nr:energy transducer TonB [Acidicapsa ligni]